MPKKISEFFQHLIVYGNFAYSDGIILMWRNPTLFFPLSSFVLWQKEMNTKYKKKGDEFFYWLGWILGKNASITLIRRYGIKEDDIKTFLDGGTQDGQGYLELLEYKPNIKKPFALVKGTNSCLAIKHKEIYGAQRYSKDYHLAGTISGGSEHIFKGPVKVKETQCIAQGKPYCLFLLEKDKRNLSSPFIRKLKINEKELQEKSLKLFSNRKTQSTILAERSIKFGDGSFEFRKIRGIIPPVYGICIAQYALERYDNKFFQKLVRKICRDMITSSFDINLKREKFDIISFNSILRYVEMFGFGKYEIAQSSSKKIILRNKNNPYPEDFVYLFGKSKKPCDIICVGLLENLFHSYYNMNVKVTETLCKSKGDSCCEFTVIFR